MRMPLALVVVVAAAAVTAPAAAQDAGSPAVQWGGGLTLASAYVWRGDTAVRGANAQPDSWVSVGPVTFRSWMAIADKGLHEHDAEVTWSQSIGALAVQAGWTNYFVPSDVTARLTNDLMAGVEYDWIVSPAVSVWQGIGAETGRYLEGALTSRLTHRRLTFEPHVALGYRHEPGGPTALHHLESTLTLEWSARTVAVRPFVTHVAGMRGGGSRTFAGLALGRH